MRPPRCETMSARATYQPGDGPSPASGEPARMRRPVCDPNPGDGDGSQRWSLSKKIRKLIHDTRALLAGKAKPHPAHRALPARNHGGTASQTQASAEFQIASSTPYAASAVATKLNPNKALGLEEGPELTGGRGEHLVGEQTRTAALLGARLEENREKELPASAYVLASDSAASHHNTPRAAETSWSQTVLNTSSSHQHECSAGDLENFSEKPSERLRENEETRDRILNAFRERQMERDRVLYSFYGGNAEAKSPEKRRNVRSSRDFIRASSSVASQSESHPAAVSLSEIQRSNKSPYSTRNSKPGNVSQSDHTHIQNPSRDASRSKSRQIPRVLYSRSSRKENDHEGHVTGQKSQETRGSCERPKGGEGRPVQGTRYLRQGSTSTTSGVSVVAEYRLGLSHSASAWA